jgi:hypothetical protein
MKLFKSRWEGPGDAPGGEGEGIVTLANFTPRAQQVLALARKEADRFNHNIIGTEHLLLGLIRLGQGVAVNVLKKLGIDLESVRREVEKQVGTGPDQKAPGNIPYTPRVKKVLVLADKEAKFLRHTYVGTEHILLGLLREGDGIAARVLRNLDVDVESTRQEILKELEPNFAGSSEVAAPSPTNPTPTPVKRETPPPVQSPRPESDSVDTSKRYDVYCTERGEEVVVYRNALFKGRRGLFSRSQNDILSLSDFVELEQADGQRLFVARRSIIKFCEHGATPGGETVSGKEP